MNQRIRHIYERLEKKSLDALLVSSPHNITYLTEYISRDSYLLISQKKNIYFTDFRYTEEAKRYLSGFTIKKTDGSAFKIIAESCHRLKFKRIGFEESYLSFIQHRKMEEDLKHKAVLVPTHGLVEDLREIKTTQELQKIKKSTDISMQALKFVRDFIVPGMKELEIAAELERFIRHKGAYASAFNIIVASGPNSSFPHHITCARKIKNNEPVLVDLGVDYEGYKSDLTRTFFSGKIIPAFRKIYSIVHEAQHRAIKAIKPAVSVNKVDRAARQYITQRGYGGFFGHSLGHGIGLEVHEAPRISQKEKNILKTGMVFTVEPAIYLPARFGIRIEDTVLVTKKGREVLSGSLDK